MPFVLDASIAVSWAFDDEVGALPERVLEALEIDSALVPVIWPLEVSNALLAAERRDRIRPADTARFIALTRALPITLDGSSMERTTGVVLDIARSHGLTTYDASYLELAMREGLSLATLDERLRGAAQSAGVELTT